VHHNRGKGGFETRPYALFHALRVARSAMDNSARTDGGMRGMARLNLITDKHLAHLSQLALRTFAK